MRSPEPLPDRPLLDVQGVSKAFAEHLVLDRVVFRLDRGQIAVLAGANGAGKSTLLRCLVGLAHHDGAGYLCGLPLADPATRALVGYLPQRVALPDHATVEECLTLVARLRNVAVHDHDLPSDFLPSAGQRVGTLSGGQRQRVALAASMLGQPPLLLLDEPGANLDEIGRELLWETLRRHAAAGGGVLVASPSPSDLRGVATREIRLRHGHVGAEDLPERSACA